MFLGHLAVGFAAKSHARRPSLGTYLVACQLPDLIWPVLLLLGVERVRIVPGITQASPMDFVSFPYTHSLLLSLVWAGLFALIYHAIRKDGRGALSLAITVFSHWVLDWITHRPDLQLLPWSPVRVGLGLWNHPMATIVIEGMMFALGLWLYLGSTKARDKIGSIALFLFALAMVGLFLASSTGPPPPSPRALAIVALSVWLFVPWAYWIDRHRAPRAAEVGARG